ncbi:hypothetical protein [Curtobacterium sp. MCSS17_007]|uniref:hypothetical protein n=1 Tax=Curtobacterium sp. MCSS17_007 TaxID=2175646 RepID=UPI0024DF9A1F|nr:hypothetical protein [Curtobacterium sp. MCSS17_007]WIE76752.1 hypothetical protein DEJ22_005695 [Curtobacterium sp. MCSS17_007]
MNSTGVLEDIPNFREGVNAINDEPFRSRESLRVREQTSHVDYQGSPYPSAPAAPAAAPTSPAPRRRRRTSTPNSSGSQDSTSPAS